MTPAAAKPETVHIKRTRPPSVASVHAGCASTSCCPNQYRHIETTVTAAEHLAAWASAERGRRQRHSQVWRRDDVSTPRVSAARCPVDEKLISPFQGTFSEDGVFETQVYAYMKTFRFTGSPALYIECDVRMCHGACPVRHSNGI